MVIHSYNGVVLGTIYTNGDCEFLLMPSAGDVEMP